MQKIKKGDLVVVRRGKYKGKSGKVLQVSDGRVIVEKINMIKRHTKPNQRNQAGGIVEKEAPMPIFKVALMDPKTSRPIRVGFTLKGDAWVRVAKQSGELIKS